MKLPKGPKVTLPVRIQRKPKAAKPSRTSRVPMPGAMNDLYRDMRDRRLIIPALALLATILAVPFALSARSEPAPEPQVPVIGDEVSAVEPAVLTEELSGVRNYRERLEELKSSNPFASRFEKQQEAAGSTLEPPPQPLAVEGSPSPVPASPTTDPRVTTPGADTPTVPRQPSDPEFVILAPRVDLHFGKLGEAKAKNRVAPGDRLPKRRPIIFLAGVTDDLRKVQFVVFTGVSSLGGEGKCEPARTTCQLLELRSGESHKLLHDQTGKRYVLKIRQIREMVVDRRKVADGD